MMAAALPGGLVVGPAPAGAAPISCGATITVSTTLAEDMTCPGDGLVIGAPGVVLDLGGHTLRGPGATFFAQDAGVRVEAMQATVRNGRIEGFRFGVHVAGGSNGSRVEGLWLDGNGDGVHVLSSSNRIAQSSMTHSNVVGVFLAGSGNVVEGNSLQQNLAGVFMVGPGHDIVGNDIVGEDGDDRGILAFFGGRVLNNRVSHYGGAAGIEILRGGEITGNQVSFTVDGIRAGPGTLVTGNVVFANADDGIHAEPGAIVGANVAVQNRDLGIEAPGAFDAGGNRAFANGNPLQCAGVACSG